MKEQAVEMLKYGIKNVSGYDYKYGFGLGIRNGTAS